MIKGRFLYLGRASSTYLNFSAFERTQENSARGLSPWPNAGRLLQLGLPQGRKLGGRHVDETIAKQLFPADARTTPAGKADLDLATQRLGLVQQRLHVDRDDLDAVDL